MLTDLTKLKGIDFSKKYIEFNTIDDFYDYDALMMQQDEYPNIDVNFEYIDNIEHVKDIDVISCYVICLIDTEISSWWDDDEITKLAVRSGHIKYSSGLDTLHNGKLLVPDLRVILTKYNLKVSGRKSELISRIEDNLSVEQLNKELPEKGVGSAYVLTKKGEEFIDKYDMHCYKIHVPAHFTREEFLLLCELNPQYSPEEICCCLWKQPWISIDKNKFTKDELYEMGFD